MTGADLGGDLNVTAADAQATLYRLQARAARYGGDVPLGLVNELSEADRRYADTQRALAALPQALRDYCHAIATDAGLEALRRHAVDVSAEAVDGPVNPTAFDPSGLLRPEFALLHREARDERPRIRREPVDDLAGALAGAERVVLQAPPGAGKTVAIKRLVHDQALTECAIDSVHRIPVLLELGDWPTGQSAAQWIAGVISGRWGAPLVAEHLGGLFARGRVLLALDAVNELPLIDNPGCLEALSRFLQTVPAGNEVILSCRPWDDLPAHIDYQRVELATLSPDRIRSLLEIQLGSERGDALWRQIDGTLLGELIAVPYFAAMLAFVVGERGAMPANQGSLIAGFVDALMAREEGHPALRAAPSSAHVAALSELAFHAHREVGVAARVGIGWATRHLPEKVEVQGRTWHLQSQAVLRLAADTNLAVISEQWSGFRFAHQLLAEWLAGQELARRALVDPRDRPSWRVPLRHDETPAVATTSTWRVSLPPPPPNGWELATILAAGAARDAGELIALVAEENVLLAGQCLAAGADGEDVRHDVVAALVRLSADPDISLRARINAGDILGELGDPRLAQPPIEVPPGPFIMGDGEIDPYDNATIAHSVHVEAFAIDRHLVTTNQYRQFIIDGGYKRAELWTSAGWRWRSARSINGPGFSDAPDASRPSSPQIGVSWYEALAYATWCGGRLPSEAEWEKAAAYDAASGISRRFPWGDGYDATRLNCRESDELAGRTTPVGIYPAGASHLGALDMAGNVWEWCSSAYERYPYRVDDGRERLDLGRNRVLRGGTFWSTRDFVRCAGRFRAFPGYRFDVAGLRVAYDRPVP